MNQDEFEHNMFLIIGLGTVLAVAEFLVIGFGGGYSLVSMHTGFLAGISMIITVIILVWFTMSFIGPEEKSVNNDERKPEVAKNQV
jgi:hypothetical protein